MKVTYQQVLQGRVLEETVMSVAYDGHSHTRRVVFRPKGDTNLSRAVAVELVYENHIPPLLDTEVEGAAVEARQETVTAWRTPR